MQTAMRIVDRLYVNANKTNLIIFTRKKRIDNCRSTVYPTEVLGIMIAV